MSDKSRREEVLLEAISLITGDRNQAYGSPTQNFQDTAAVWNVIFGHKLSEELTAGDVAAAMVALKLVRMKAQPKDDNWVDIAGYAACGNEVDRETGVIPPPPKQQVSEWVDRFKPGTEFLLIKGNEEIPGVSVIKTFEGTGIPYLHKRDDGMWQWSTDPDYIEPGYYYDTWRQMTFSYPGRYEVIR